MRLGEWIKEYRVRNSMSMQDMANACGFSKAYISMLERGINPTTGKPVSPTMQALKKIAVATGQDVDSLLRILDDEQPITIKPSAKNFSDDETKLIDDYRNLNGDGRSLILAIINSLRVTHSKQNKNNSSIVQSNSGSSNFFATSGENHSFNVTGV